MHKFLHFTIMLTLACSVALAKSQSTSMLEESSNSGCKLSYTRFADSSEALAALFTLNSGEKTYETTASRVFQTSGDSTLSSSSAVKPSKKLSPNAVAQEAARWLIRARPVLNLEDIFGQIGGLEVTENTGVIESTVRQVLLNELSFKNDGVFPYSLLGFDEKQTFVFKPLCAPILDTAIYPDFNNFMRNLYQSILPSRTGVSDVNQGLGALHAFKASLKPSSVIPDVISDYVDNTRDIILAFYDFTSTLHGLRSTAGIEEAVHRRLDFVLAVAHVVFDFNNADTSVFLNAFASATRYVQGTSMVKSATVCLNGVILDVAGGSVNEEPLTSHPSFLAVKTATRKFIGDLLQYFSYPFMKNIMSCEKIKIFTAEEYAQQLSKPTEASAAE